MESIIYDGKPKVCSECGKEFSVSYPSMYKYRFNGDYQCSYTCYDHVLLRLKDSKSLSNYNKSVDKCESIMRSQGKTILHPIKRVDF